MYKKCSACKIGLTIDSFHNSKINKDGKSYRCKYCDKEARLKYRENNKERFKEVSKHKNWLCKYNITPEFYKELLEKQRNICAICETNNPCGEGNNSNHLKNFAVDHCHITGKIRGLLCNKCNRGLGFFNDDVNLIKDVIYYLENS